MVVDIAIPCRGWLGETWGFWIQTGALFASVIGALWIVWSRERSERRRATVDLLIEQLKDEALVSAKLFVRAESSNLIRFLSNKDADEYRQIIRVLNNYEFIASAIRERALDDELYKRNQWTIVVRYWQSLEPFVTELRRQDQHPTLFQEFEALALGWKKRPLQVDKDR